MNYPFTKMHGLGNDFVIFNQIDHKVPKSFTIQEIKAICSRNYGIGCDQMISLINAKDAACEMLIFNSDGSKASACGNATRCVAKLLSYVNTKILINERIIEASLLKNGLISLDMGSYSFHWEDIPLTHKVDEQLISLQGYNGYCVNVGNPHFVVYLDNRFEKINIRKIGERLEKDKIFLEKANISFVQKISANQIKVKVWERGSGQTLACGTAACASAVVGHKFYNLNKSIKVNLLGGQLGVKIHNDKILLEGPAEKTFDGVWYGT